MNRTTSIYLDLVRFVAALLVFIHHLANERFTGSSFTELGVFGEDAVMVFFVLSGYMIAYVAAEKEATPREYFTSRFARLYSVAVPSLLVTVIFDYIGQQTDDAFYRDQSSDSHPWIRTLVSLSFTNQFWFFDIRFFSNVPYWSISYEFWYYVLFGVVLFLRGKFRWMVLLSLAILIGPSIMLLAPVWLLGVAVYRLNTHGTISIEVGWVLFLGSIIAYLGYRYGGLGPRFTALSDSWIIPIMDPLHMHKARFFIHDYVVGGLVATHFVGAAALARTERVELQAMEVPIRFAASYTFSLYLLHYPLLHLLASVAPWPAGDGRRTVILIIGTILVVLLVGSVTERKKHLWKRFFLVLWDSAMKRCHPSHSRDIDQCAT